MLLLVLLAYASGDPAMKENLRSFLSFYRENREVFAMLTQKDAPMSETPPQEAQKNRPSEAKSDLKIFEEYLGKLG